MAKTQTFNFEQNLAKLETVVESLEDEDLALEDALKQYEAGIKLTRDCQNALQKAEQKVKILMEKHGQTELLDFNEEEQDD